MLQGKTAVDVTGTMSTVRKMLHGLAAMQGLCTMSK